MFVSRLLRWWWSGDGNFCVSNLTYFNHVLVTICVWLYCTECTLFNLNTRVRTDAISCGHSFAITTRVVLWGRRRSRRSLIREWFDLNDGMLPPLPLSFSPTWSLDKCQSVCPFGEEIKADLWRGIHYKRQLCWEQISPLVTTVRRSNPIQFNWMQMTEAAMHLLRLQENAAA